MEIAFLNLCHCDPKVVARTAKRLTTNPNFDMYIHVDAKQDIGPFKKLLNRNSKVYFIKNRHKVYWGGYNAVLATCELLEAAMKGPKEYDYFVLLQNLDYPIKSEAYIENFFEEHKGKEFIRACNIASIKDWHFARKYRLYNDRDKDFYIKNTSKTLRHLRNLLLGVKSIQTIGFNGTIKEENKEYPIYYGAAQWAITRECARYILDFKNKHHKYNQIMSHIQFPDEEYFHTIVHNSPFKRQCHYYDEPVKRWLVNWRNLHYFEYPKEITVFGEQDFEKLMGKEELFIRKVRTEKSEKLMDLIDEAVKVCPPKEYPAFKEDYE